MATETTEKKTAKKPTAKKPTATSTTKKSTTRKAPTKKPTTVETVSQPQPDAAALHAERIAMLKETAIPKAPTDAPTPPSFGGSKAIFPICAFSLLLALSILCLLSILATWPTLESLFHGELLETAPEWAAPAMAFSIPVRIVLAIFLMIWAWKIPKKFRQILKSAKNAKTAWKKAMAGDTDEQVRLAFQYRNNPKTYAYSAYFATTAASTGHCRGLFALGCLLVDGKALPKDEKRAMELFELSAESNHGGAIYNLGIYAMKNGDEVLAYEYWKKAAELRNPYAAFNMGIFHYQKIKGIKISDCTAAQKEHNYEMFRYFRIAAKQGLGAAERNLGFLYGRNFYIENTFEYIADFWTKRSNKTLSEKSTSVNYYGKPFTTYQLRQWNITKEEDIFPKVVSRVKMDRSVFNTYYIDAFRGGIGGDYTYHHSVELSRWKAKAEWKPYQKWSRRESAKIKLQLFGSATIYIPDTETNVQAYVKDILSSYTYHIRKVYTNALLQDSSVKNCPSLLECADNVFMIIDLDISELKIEQAVRTKYVPTVRSANGRPAPSNGNSGKTSGGSKDSGPCNDYQYTDVDISYSTSGSYTDSLYGTENVTVSGSATFYYENSQGDRTSRTASFSFSCSKAYVDSEVEKYVNYNLGHYKTY